ncbi:MAG: hypothetical protein ACYSWP_23610 [Planctomycetota bacterium]
MPNKWLTIVFTIFYLLTYIIDHFFIRILGFPSQPGLAELRKFFLIGFAVIHGFNRVRYFHPFYNRRYRQFLAITPWSAKKPFPFGPIHLTLADLFVLGILTLLQYLNGHFHIGWPAIAFLTSYLTFFALTFEYAQIRFLIAFLALLPFTVYPHRDHNIALILLLVLYGWILIGFIEQFKRFPWTTKYWKSDPVKDIRDESKKYGVIGWPYTNLNFYDPTKISVISVFILSVLFVWWVHVIGWMIDKKFSFALVIMLTLYIALFKLLSYVGVYKPPISFLGRIFTGRLIIPKYDKILIAPICIIAADVLWLIFMPYFFWSRTVLCSELLLLLVLLLAFLLPPKQRSWKFTGPHRIRKPPSLEGKRKPPSERDKLISEFFFAKFKTN